MEKKPKNIPDHSAKEFGKIGSFSDKKSRLEKMLEIRKKIIESLVENLEANPSVTAAFIVGSDAQNMVDEYSYIDFDIVLDKENIEEIKNTVKQTLEKFSPIKTELKRTTMKGAQQVIYQFSSIPKFLHIDVMYLPSIDFIDIEGQKIKVLFDKENIIKPKELKEGEIIEEIKEKIERKEKYYELSQTYLEREVNRGHFLGAIEKYHELVLKRVIEMLRFLHCPEKSDYYVKHIEKDLPDDVVRQIEDLFKITSLEDIEAKNKIAGELLDETIKNLKLKYGIKS